MIAIEKIRKLGINLGAVGLEQSDTSVTYFCTPKDAEIIGWAGVDGIHYCTIPEFGEMIFAISPMNFGDYVHPIARNLEDLLRMLLFCVDMAALEQCYAWDSEQFKAFMIDCPATEKQQAVLDAIRDKLQLKPMEDTFAYVKALQAEFDLSKIPYTEEYYDPDMNAAAPALPAGWKVTYDGGLWGQQGRAGKEIPVNKEFEWDGQRWLVPAIYACGKGLVMDICMEAEPDGIRTFIEKWDLLHEDEHHYSNEEMRRMEQEHPLNIDFRPHVILNGKPLRNEHGSGEVWIPVSCLADGIQCERDSLRALEHYGLDTSKGWMIRRCSFAWATAKKPKIKSLTLTLERELTDIPGIRFVAPAVGESISFTHPVSGTEHTLTVCEYEQNELNAHHFRDTGMEYPTHHHAMSYSLAPDLPNRSFMIRDCADGDSPRIKNPNPNEFAPVCIGSAASIGIIGGADGPTATFVTNIVTNRTESKLHAACSSLHFEQVDEVEWQITFREKTVEDITVDVI